VDIKTLCLGTLTLGDASGYEIRKMFEDGPFAHFHDASFGSIYPALAKLRTDGLVTVTEHAQNGRPDKKVYAITPEGLDVFKAALRQPPVRDKLRSEHIVRMFFAELMEPEDLEAVFTSYLDHFRSCVAHMEGLDPTDVPPGRMFVRDMGTTFYRTMADYLETNREKLLGPPQQDNKPADDPDPQPLLEAGE
jgi:DNA-binding PadR family transcriptional regulator